MAAIATANCQKGLVSVATDCQNSLVSLQQQHGLVSLWRLVKWFSELPPLIFKKV